MTAVIKYWSLSKGSATSNKITGILRLNARQDDSMYEVTTSPSIRHKIHLILCRKLQMTDSPITMGLQQNYNR